MGKNLAPKELRISPRICPAYCAAPSVPPAPATRALCEWCPPQRPLLPGGPAAVAARSSSDFETTLALKNARRVALMAGEEEWSLPAGTQKSLPSAYQRRWSRHQSHCRCRRHCRCRHRCRCRRRRRRHSLRCAGHHHDDCFGPLRQRPRCLGNDAHERQRDDLRRRHVVVCAEELRSDARDLVEDSRHGCRPFHKPSPNVRCE